MRPRTLFVGSVIAAAFIMITAACTVPPTGGGTTTTTDPPSSSQVLVTQQSGPEDGICDSTCSLREAVELANDDPAIDTVLVPPGTYVLDESPASGAPSAATMAPGPAPDPSGPSGEFLDVRNRLTIRGTSSNPADTVFDLTTNAYTVGFLTTHSLRVENITVRGLGSQETAEARQVTKADLSGPDQVIELINVVVEDAGANMEVPSTASSFGPQIVGSAGNGIPFDVVIAGSEFRDFGITSLDTPPIHSEGGDLTVTDSVFDRVPMPIFVGELLFGPAVLPAAATVERTVITNTWRAISDISPGGTYKCEMGDAVWAGTTGAAYDVLTLRDVHIGVADTPGPNCPDVTGEDLLSLPAAVALTGGRSRIERTTIDTGTSTPIVQSEDQTDDQAAYIGNSTLIAPASEAFPAIWNYQAEGEGGINVINSTLRGTDAPEILGFPVNTAVIACGTDRTECALDEQGASLTNSVVITGAAGSLCGDSGGLTGFQAGNLFSEEGDCFVLSLGANRFGVDPMLGPLGDNGGFAPTMDPQPGSPVADTAVCVGFSGWGDFSIDQVGRARPTGNGCDVGAVESTEVLAPGLQIDTNGAHTCALESGQLSCWGFDLYGQLGDGTIGSPDADTSPVAVSLPGDVTDFSAGLTHTCAVVSGDVYCWGRGLEGQLDGTVRADSPSPVQVPGISGAVQVSAGYWTTCAVLSTGDLQCWGSAYVGDGPIRPLSSPTSPVPVASGVEDVDLGIGHGCLLRSGQTVECWGHDTSGQLGNGMPLENSGTPVEVIAASPGTGPLSDVKEIELGYDHACALVQDTEDVLPFTVCWGHNAEGQVDADSADPAEPRPTYPSLTTFGVPTTPADVELAAGGSNTCRRSNSTAVSCWGSNVDGQLGQLPTGSSNQGAAWVIGEDGPFEDSSLVGVTDVASGQDHSCASLVGGSIKCWGSNFAGQLGDPATVGSTDIVPPVDVSGF